MLLEAGVVVWQTTTGRPATNAAYGRPTFALVYPHGNRRGRPLAAEIAGPLAVFRRPVSVNSLTTQRDTAWKRATPSRHSAPWLQIGRASCREREQRRGAG